MICFECEKNSPVKQVGICLEIPKQAPIRVTVPYCCRCLKETKALFEGGIKEAMEWKKENYGKKGKNNE